MKKILINLSFNKYKCNFSFLNLNTKADNIVLRHKEVDKIIINLINNYSDNLLK